MPEPWRTNLICSLERAVERGVEADEFNVWKGDSGILLGIVDGYWEMYEDKGRFSPRLRYLYTQREVIDYVRRRLFEHTTFTEGGVTQSDSDAFKALSDLRGDLDKDIATLEVQVRAGQSPAVAAMTTTQIGPVPAIGPNPGDSRYLGDPLKKSFYFPR